ncbi:MAG: flippase-like domain-containing protein [Anaerolineae bacterium]|nr:flippase-like domain-containing protein [Anaerolineae bacterium]
MNRKQLINLLKIVVSITLLVVIFASLEFDVFVAVVGRANPWLLLTALILILLGVVVRAYRWQILLNAIGVRVALGELTAIYFIGFLFNNLLPSGLGGDAMRMIELNRHTERGSDAVTSVIVDRYLGLLGLQAIALVALIFSWGAVPTVVAYFTVVIFSAGLVAFFLLTNRPLYLSLRAKIGIFRKLTDIKMIGNLFESFQRYPLLALAQSFAVALLFNVLWIAANYLIGLALGAEATLAQYAVFIPITSLVLVIPISFAGLGVREGAYRELFGQVGVPAETAVAMALLIYIFGNFVTGLIGGVIYLLRGARGVVSERG